MIEFNVDLNQKLKKLTKQYDVLYKHLEFNNPKSIIEEFGSFSKELEGVFYRGFSSENELQSHTKLSGHYSFSSSHDIAYEFMYTTKNPYRYLIEVTEFVGIDLSEVHEYLIMELEALRKEVTDLEQESSINFMLDDLTYGQVSFFIEENEFICTLDSMTAVVSETSDSFDYLYII